MDFPHPAGHGHKLSPLLIFGIVAVGAFVVYSYMKGGSSGGTVAVQQSGASAANTALQIANQQGQAALAIANLQAGAQAHVADLAASVKKDENATSLAAILATLQEKQSETGMALTAAHDANQTQVQIAQLAAGLTAQQIAAQTSVAEMQLANEHAATQKEYLLAYHAQNVQDNVNAWNYTLAYQQNANAAAATAQANDLTQQLIDRLPTAA